MYKDSLSEVTIDNVLAKGEKVLWRGTPQKNAYVLQAIVKMLPLAIIWLLFDTTFIVVMVVTGILQEETWLLGIIIPFFLLHLAPVWIWLYGILKASKGHKNIEYAVTERRVIEKSGLVGINFISVYYQEIQSAKVIVSPTDRMFHVGDVVIKGPTSTVSISDQKEPYALYQLIQQNMTQAQSGAKKVVCKCSFCGATAPEGTYRCPNCNAIMAEES